MTALGQIETAKALVRRTAREAKRRTPLVEALARERMAFLHAAIVSLFIGATVVAGSIFFEQVNDRVLPHKNLSTLWVLFAALVVLLTIGAYLNRQRDHILERVSIRVDAAVRPALFEAFIRSRFDTGTENAATGLDDLEKVRTLLSGRGLSALYDMIPVPAYLAVCFAIHLWLGLFVSAALVTVILLAVVLVGLRTRYEGAQRELARAKGDMLLSTFVNIEAIQALGMRQVFRERWISRHRRGLAMNAAAEDRLAPLDTLLNFMITATGGMTIAVGAYLGVLGEISPGNVIGCMLLSSKLVQPVGILTAEWGFFLRAGDAFGNLQGLFRSLESRRRDGYAARPDPVGDLEVEDLAMAAPRTNRFILSQVSFAVPAGSALGVIGPSGAGKSTLVRALVGIWPPTHGSVRLDGAEMQHWDPDRLGLHLGYLPQNVELLSGTIAENIARFGAVDDAAVLEAARLAGVHDVIQGLAQGYNTQVGEGGSALSGGQRQRVGLARALYGRPALIVLDEPNSNLDALGEGALAEALKAMKERGTTCILITHKANILKTVDFVLVLKDGTLSAFGPRDAILAPAGVPSIAPPPTPPQITARHADTGDAA